MAALAGTELPVVLRVGAILGAKVLERHDQHGLLMLNGAAVVAELPDDIPAGARLRLQVADVTGDKVTLQLHQPQDASAATQASQTPPNAAFALALPGGATLRLHVDEREGTGQSGRPRARSLALRYDSPELGRLDFRIASDAIAIHAVAGEPADRAAAGAPELQQRVSAATGVPVQVTVHARTTGSVDVRG